MTAKEKYSYISKDLRSLAYPVDKLELLPGNNRRGDIDSVAKSLEVFGQRKPIVCRLKENSDIGIVLAGNTTLQGARRNGWSHIAVSWEEDDDKTAAAFAIADNRTHDLGDYDEQATIDMIATFEDDPLLFDASGFDLADVQELIENVTRQELDDPSDMFDDDDDDEAPEPKPQNPVIQYTIIFDDEEQQALWFAFLRWAKKEYRDADTLAERITIVLRDVLPDDL